MKKLIFTFVFIMLLASCNDSVWVEEIGDDFKFDVEECFATSEITIIENGKQSILEVSFLAASDNSPMNPESEKEDGYYLFLSSPEAKLRFSVSNLPETYSVIWKDTEGTELFVGSAFEFKTPEVEESYHVYISNGDGFKEGAVKFRVRNSEVNL